LKFTDGNWLIREEYEVNNPIEVRDYEINDNELTIYAPDKPIDHRSDTISSPLYTIKISSPGEDIIKVRFEHFKGGQDLGPHFELQELENSNSIIEEEEAELLFKSGNLKVVIDKKNYSLKFYNGEELLTESGFKNTAYIKNRENDRRYVREQLNLDVGEYIYGLGERFTPYVKNGQVVDIWNRDGGTSSEQAYKNIPFYVSNQGYGVLVNHPEKVSFEVASERVDKVQFSVEGEALEYYIFNGSDLKDVLKRYTDLVGKPSLPPAWSFGLWLSTSFTTDYDEETVNSFVDGMKERYLPLDVFHFDCFWMKEYHWSNFKWDDQLFPDPKAMLARLKEKGLKICVWINPYIAQRSYLFEEGRKNGYLLKKKNGDVWQWDKWQAGMGIVDFTNPEACKWYQSKLEELLDLGVDSFKTDFGERIPTDVEYFDGSDPDKMHNYYTYLYNKTVFDLLTDKFGREEAVVFARSATVGGQKFPVHWGGDCYSDYNGMAETLRGGLSLALSGFSFWSHDIGGFETTGPADIYKRWIAFGLLSSHSRLHGSKAYRVPWLYDEESVEVLRYFTKLKYSLMPYIYKQAVEASETGVPVLRPMILEFQDDPGCDYLDRQYMLGDSLMVAPVFNEDGRVKYYLPEGRWTNFLSGEVIEGGGWIKEKHGYKSLPLMVRPNSIIAVGQAGDSADYDYSQNVEFHVFELSYNSPVSTKVYDNQGELKIEISVLREDDKISIKVKNEGKDYSIVLNNLWDYKKVDHGQVEESENGVKVIPEKDAEEIVVWT